MRLRWDLVMFLLHFQNVAFLQVLMVLLCVGMNLV